MSVKPKKILTSEEQATLRGKRVLGWSINELKDDYGISYRKAHEYTEGVLVDPQYLDFLKSKTGGSRKICIEKIERINKEVSKILTPSKPITTREKLIALSMLYWGEGCKTDFSFSNSDPDMVRLVIRLVSDVLGIGSERFRMSIRIYGDMDSNECVEFWEKVTGIKVRSVNVLIGNKKGKLKYGMCRVRVTKACDIIKLLKSFWSQFATLFAPIAQVDRAQVS